MKKRNLMTKLLAIVMILAMALGCCNVAVLAEENSYDLTFWVYADVLTTEVQNTAMNQIIDNFLTKDPEVKSITMIPKNDDELVTQVMAGVGLPDCIYASARDGYNYDQAIDLIDLTDAFNAENEKDPEFLSGFYDYSIDNVTTNDGRIIAAPFITYIPLIFRNLDILEAAGIDPAEGIPTWDRFIEQMDMIQKAGYTPTHSWAGSSWYSLGAIIGCEGDMVDETVTNGKTNITPESLIRPLETLLRIKPYANNTVYGDDSALEAFKAGEIAFCLDGPWSEPGVIDAGINYDVALVPPYEEGGRTGGCQGWDYMYGIATGDEGRDAAIARFMTHLCTKESETIWLQVVGRTVLRQDVMDNHDNWLVASTSVQAEGLRGGKIQQKFCKTSVRWASPAADVANPVWKGEMTVEEGAQEFVRILNNMIIEAEEE